MAFEHVAGISLNDDENTFQPESTCYQAVLRFYIWIKEMFSNSIICGLMENYDESAAVLILPVFVSREHIESPKVFWKESLQIFKGWFFLEYVTSEIFNPISWSFFSKCTKFYVDGKNAKKIPENIYGFWDNGVWTCSWNLYELWEADMWAAVNALRNSPEISHLTKRDVF